MDCSLPDYSVNGILQARMFEWVATSFSRLVMRSSTFSCPSRQFTCFLWKNACSVPLLIFKSGCFMSSFYVLVINPYSETWFTKFSSHPVGCLFISLIVSFTVQKLLFDVIPFVDFVVVCGFDVISKISVTRPILRSVFSLFPSRSFIVSDLMFNCLIHFELIFWIVWNRSPIHFPACASSIFRTPLLKRLSSFPIGCSCLHC